MSRADAAALQRRRRARRAAAGLDARADEPDVTTDTAPTEKATIGPDGLAIAPASAPAEVKAIIAAGNEIHAKPYKYGGGHGRWKDTGYDCSGSMSYAFHGAGMLDEALDSTGFMSWGEAGKGQWVTTYANSGHSYMVVAGLRFDTSGRADDGSRWHTDMRSAQRLHRAPPCRALVQARGRGRPDGRARGRARSSAPRRVRADQEQRDQEPERAR